MAPEKQDVALGSLISAFRKLGQNGREFEGGLDSAERPGVSVILPKSRVSIETLRPH